MADLRISVPGPKLRKGHVIALGQTHSAMSIRPDGKGTRWSDYTLAIVESAKRDGTVVKVRVAGDGYAQKLAHMAGNVHVLRISAEYAQEAARKMVAAIDAAKAPVYWRNAETLREAILTGIVTDDIANLRQCELSLGSPPNLTSEERHMSKRNDDIVNLQACALTLGSAILQARIAGAGGVAEKIRAATALCLKARGVLEGGGMIHATPTEGCDCCGTGDVPPLPREAAFALDIVRHLVRQWQCVDGASACDLLDACANMACDAGIVTGADVERWIAEQDAANR